MDLQDKVVVITGGGQGLGRQMALRLAAKGAKLALVDLNQEKLDEACGICKEAGGDAKGYMANIAQEAEVEKLFNDIVADFGAVHGLINNAGILRDGLMIKAKDGEIQKRMSLAEWQAVIDELISLDFTLSPTFTIYEANRDVARARDAEWHEDYTLPLLTRFFGPDPHLHGSYFFDWTTADEVAWRNNFHLWMQFINDYKNAGGRVVTGSDSGFIYKIYGFGYIRELELLQEAGFHPLEVLQAATLNGAELLGLEDITGTLVPGKKADIVLVEGNPIANFKLLYGTGHMYLDREAGELRRVGGVSYTITNGVVYDAKALLTDVRAMVADANAANSR